MFTYNPRNNKVVLTIDVENGGAPRVSVNGGTAHELPAPVPDLARWQRWAVALLATLFAWVVVIGPVVVLVYWTAGGTTTARWAAAGVGLFFGVWCALGAWGLAQPDEPGWVRYR